MKKNSTWWKVLLLVGILLEQSTSIMVRADEGWYASLVNDTLRMGNSRMERCWRWNGGNIVSLRLTDKASGHSLQAAASQPDFTILRGEATEGTLTTEVQPADGVREAYLEARVTFRMGSARVERRFRIHADCPAIACETWLKGDVRTEDWDGEGALEQLFLPGRHWQTRTVELTDYTDLNDNLVAVRDFVPMNAQKCRGNLLFAKNMNDGQGFFFLKEAPCPDKQLHYPGADFIFSAGHFAVLGAGLVATDIQSADWRNAYTTVTGIYNGGEKEALLALHAYQREQRKLMADGDNMIMMNTWGERGEGRNINEAFCLEELTCGAELGINVFQLDAGWESNYTDWKINPTKFPKGLHPVMARAKALGIRMALWFAPRWENDFAKWEEDAQKLIDLYKEYGISIFKIDGYNLPTKRAEENLFRMLNRITEGTNRQAIFNMDETAGQRVGYFTTAKYGNIFMENRYTDWGNYYPFHTLRNIWQLARYVEARRLQVEFLNPRRNPQQYADNDCFAPKHYTLPYLFAITMAGQPLAWLEAHNLSPEERQTTGAVVRAYAAVSDEFHRGTILPIGEEPCGTGWTGFQSILSEDAGYLLVYREENERSSHLIQTYLPANAELRLQLITGEGKNHRAHTDSNGSLHIALPSSNSFALYRYEVRGKR